VKPWRTLASVATAEGLLELRQRGDRDFLLVIDGRVLMTSAHRRSEEALAELALAPLAALPAPRVLVGGLGMGFTLAAALAHLPPGARVIVAELSPDIAAWCRGPLAPLTGDAAGDPRVDLRVTDVARVIAGAPPGSLDVIVLDLYEGPNAATQDARDPLYGAGALGKTRRALAPGGMLAVWGEDLDDAFVRRLAAAGFAVDVQRPPGSGGRIHVVYLGRATPRAP
jgi:spermidine synthase